MQSGRSPDAGVRHGYVSEDALLLREFAHRTGNEVASALAAIHLHRRARGTRTRRRLLEDAVRRLEHFGAVNRMLAAPLRGDVDVGGTIETLVRGLVAGRADLDGSSIALLLPATMVDAAIARRMALIASEVVSNALTYALADRSGSLTLSLASEDGVLSLRVEDDGPGIRTGASATGTGWGRGLVLELAARGGGTVDVTTGPHGTTVTVALPNDGVGGLLDDDIPF